MVGYIISDAATLQFWVNFEIFFKPIFVPPAKSQNLSLEFKNINDLVNNLTPFLLININQSNYLMRFL